MQTRIKYRLLLAFSFLCLIGFAVQSVQLWRLSDSLTQLAPDTDALPASIEERLLAQLDKNSQPRTRFTGTPFAGFSPLQDYMDSFFTGFAMPPFPVNTPLSRGGFSFVSAMPQIALDETEEDFHILIPVNPNQEIELSTNIEDNAVSVSGVITEKLQQSQNSFTSAFHSQRQFAKTVELPSPIDQFGMTTEQTNEGIRITIPKKAS